MFEPLFQAFEIHGRQLFFVGGFVRDLLIARTKDKLSPVEEQGHELRLWANVVNNKADVDFATDAPPNETSEILEDIGLPVIPIGIEFGTIQTKLDGVKVEITTFRVKESYKKGDRKPAVVFGTDIKEDLARRDFTVNAIAMKEDGTLIDPFGGSIRLVEGLLETPLDAEISFTDDPLRMLRAARFSARGIATPSWEVAEACRNLREKILDVSQERIFEELTKLLISSRPDLGLRFLETTGLLELVLPEVAPIVKFKTKNKSKDLWAHTLVVLLKCNPDPAIRWTALFHDVGKPDTVRENGGVTFHGHEERGAELWEQAARRLKVGNEFRERVKNIVAKSGQFVEMSKADPSDKGMRRFIREVGRSGLKDIFIFTFADITSKNDAKVRAGEERVFNLWFKMDRLIEADSVDTIKLPTGLGSKISEALNLKPGPELGKVMKALLQMRVDGELTADANFIEEAKKLHGN